MIKSNRDTRTLNDERKHSERENEELDDLPNLVPDEDEEDEEGEGNPDMTLTSKPRITLYTRYKCKEKKLDSYLSPFWRRERQGGS